MSKVHLSDGDQTTQLILALKDLNSAYKDSNSNREYLQKLVTEKPTEIQSFLATAIQSETIKDIVNACLISDSDTEPTDFKPDSASKEDLCKALIAVMNVDEDELRRVVNIGSHTATITSICNDFTQSTSIAGEDSELETSRDTPRQKLTQRSNSSFNLDCVTRNHQERV